MLFRNVTYSIAWAFFNHIVTENDKGVDIKKETAVAITININSKIYKYNLVA